MRRRIFLSTAQVMTIVLTLLWWSLPRCPEAASLLPFGDRPAFAGTTETEKDFGFKMVPNGEYEIYLLKAGQWTKAGSLSFDKFLREKEIDLSGFLPAGVPAKLRIVQKGGGSAHIDSVFWGGKPPVKVNGEQGFNLKKLSQKDMDIINVGVSGVELEFPALDRDTALAVTARIESTVISQIPFQFPLDNTYHKINENSSFYTYKLNPVKGRITVDGNIGEVADMEPFMKEYVTPGSGHPAGDIYAWVMNDDQNLYVAFDVIPDNTMDDDKDYGKVYVKSVDGLKEYKVSVPETTWGEAAFIYTDRVGYQHKIYEFFIPLVDIGIQGNQLNTELLITFSVYGTVAPPSGDFKPAISYDPENNRYFSVYQKQSDYDSFAYGDFVNSTGIPSGNEFNLSSFEEVDSPSVAYGVYNGTGSRYLVVWEDGYSYGIKGQLIDANDGSYIGGVITMSDNDAIPTSVPSVVYDSANERFLVVWEDYRYTDPDPRSHNIYGQIVNADGSLFGNNFAICNNDFEQYTPCVAYDANNQRYLVVWRDLRNFINDIYGQFVNADGTLADTTSKDNFVISNTNANKYNPVVAFDDLNSRFLVAWADYRGGGAGSEDIYGQLVDADTCTLFGTASTDNFVISSAPDGQENPALAYDSTDNRFLVAWTDKRNGGTTFKDIYGQLVEEDGTLYPDAGDSSTNFVINNDDLNQTLPSLAYNTRDDSFLAAFEDQTLSDISYAVVEDQAAPPAPPPVSFRTAVNYEVGGQPYAITAGDFNNDSKTDLAVTNVNTSNFSILLGTGDGTFQQKVDYGPLYAPLWITTGLFDNDGILDLAITSGEGLAVFAGDGSGAFPGKVGYSTGTSPNTVIAADYNGDGRADLAVSNQHSNSVSIYLQTIGGAFEPKTDFGVGQGPARMAAGDFNNDGKIDLAVVNGTAATVSVLIGDGSGSFAKMPVDYAAGSSPIGIAAADLDGDNKTDLAIGNFDTSFDFSGNVTVLRGSGDGSFNKMTDLEVSDGPVGIISGDFNSDGNTDLAVTNRYRNNVSILCGNGSGDFAPKQNFNTGNSPMILTAGDYNGDGKTDLAVVNYNDSSISILLNGVDDQSAPTWPVDSLLTVTNISKTSLTLSWEAAADNEGVTGYKVFKDGILLESVNGSTTTYNVTGLSPSTSYTFKVEAGDAAGNWTTTGPSVTVTTVPSVPDAEAPTWPGGSTFSASNVGQTSLTLTWSAAEDNVDVTGYRIYSDGGTVLRATVGSVLTTDITGLSPSTSYTFTIQARDAEENWSGGPTTGPSVTVTTAVPSVPDTEAPLWPGGSTITASNVGETGLTLIWSDATDNVGVTQYRVYQNGNPVATVVGTSCNVTGLTKNTSYTFKVEACDASGNWSASGPSVTVTTASGGGGGGGSLPVPPTVIQPPVVIPPKPVTITGTVNTVSETTGQLIPLAGLRVHAVPASGGSSAGSTIVRYDGSFTISGLKAGSYKLQFIPPGQNSKYPVVWYDNKKTPQEADVITLTEGDTLTVNATLYPPKLYKPRAVNWYPYGDGMKYNVIIPSGAVKDAQGNVMAEQYEFQFITGNR